MVNRTDKILEKVKSALSAHRMISPEDRVVVAVSGGPDSVCLLDILYAVQKRLRVRLLVAHFDHRLRPDEDEAETQFVRDLARTYGLPFETQRAKGLVKGCPSLEEKAREARYRFLRAVKEKHAAQKIAFGHTLNDQAETVLMRLLRGSGPPGLSGIPPVREGDIIRPLLTVNREEVLTYLKEQGLSFVEDPTNRAPVHLRNRIRLELMPLLAEYQPRIVEILGQTADILRADEAYFLEQAENWLDCEGDDGLSASALLQLSIPVRMRVIRAALRTVGGSLRRIGTRHLEAVNRLAEVGPSQGELHLPGGILVRRVYERLLFSAEEEGQEPPEDFLFQVEGPGTHWLKEIGRHFSIRVIRERDRQKTTGEERVYLDGEKVGFPLTIRSFRPGDRFVPLGMKGHKKVKDLFIALKIPSAERRRIPILTYRDEPVWICGIRLDDRFKVTAASRKILEATFVTCPSSEGTALEKPLSEELS